MASDGLSSPAGQAVLWWAFAAGAFLLLQWAAGALQVASATALGERVDAVLQRDLMEAVMAPEGIGHLEDPRLLDLINVGRETFRAGASRPGRLVFNVARLAVGRVVFLGSCLIVARFHPVLGLALLGVGLWAGYEDKVASRMEAARHHSDTELARRTEYYYDLGVTPPAAKEVRVFGLARFLLERFEDTWRRSMAGVIVPAGPRPLIAAVALGSVVLVGIGWVAHVAMAGGIGVGPATVYAQALVVSIGGLQSGSWASLQIELALATLRRYEDAVVAIASSHPASGYPSASRGTKSAAAMPGQEIRFEGVSFSYSGASSDARHELDLVIPAGRSLAIVGANGAGKTTLVKLLCRLYEPTGGRITVDGVDLADLDIAGWRRRIGAVFQDSTRFELSARANVGFGRVDALDAHQGNEVHAAIDRAGALAGVAERIERLPAGWETPLSAEYAGGVELSGGEWQKIGLARALFAVSLGATVLVLDEPAAQLDARAEAALYARFLELTEGLTTIVISHRFSTVRRADSIVVLDEGRVVERGTHDELITLGGAYAELFRLQAARFSDDAEDDSEGVGSA